MTSRILHKLVAAALFAALLPGWVSCGKQEAEKKAVVPSMTILTNPAAKAADSQFLVIDAEGDWTITLSYQGAQSGWANVSPKTGTDSRRNVLFEWDANTAEEPRSVLLTITGKTGKSDVLFTQKGTKDMRAANSGVKATKLGWMELPATSGTDSYDFFTRSMTYRSTTVRNYSYYWDYDYYVARWVAYPLVGNYIGKVDRDDNWQIDPMLQRDQQPVVMFRGFSSAGCDRGHQLPSKDRTFDDASNKSTFYGTNQTPQYSSFNQGIWVGIETLVRTWAMKCDTLYVVTGCVPDGTRDFAEDNDGKDIAIPVAYWKAVLALSGDSYSACGFYLPHNNSYPRTGNDLQAYRKSIRQLESILGYDLFVNLPAKVGAAKAKEIEEKDPTSEWWWGK